MIYTKSKLYNDPRWIKKAREEKNRVGHCERCWSTEHLICHHVIPLQWQNDMLEVNDFDKEVINVPTEVLCHKCHQGKERSGDLIDYARIIAEGLM